MHLYLLKKNSTAHSLMKKYWLGKPGLYWKIGYDFWIFPLFFALSFHLNFLVQNNTEWKILLVILYPFFYIILSYNNKNFDNMFNFFLIQSWFFCRYIAPFFHHWPLDFSGICSLSWTNFFWNINTFFRRFEQRY